MGVKVILKRFVMGKLEGKGHLRRACECRRKKLKWILRELYHGGFGIFILQDSLE